MSKELLEETMREAVQAFVTALNALSEEVEFTTIEGDDYFSLYIPRAGRLIEVGIFAPGANGVVFGGAVTLGLRLNDGVFNISSSDRDYVTTVKVKDLASDAAMQNILDEIRYRYHL